MSATARGAAISRGDLPARRSHILDAAQACFTRAGFHRTTMQDIAREAAMSPANIYRYFASKEAVVTGLAEREGARAAALVAALERHGDPAGTVLGLINAYFVEISRETAAFRLELWSEMHRNPALADLARTHEDGFRDWFVAALAPAGGGEAATLYETVSALLKGIVVNRAVRPGYDPGPAASAIRARIEAVLTGGPIRD
ncbi:TetR/AcrR family transcriptional regulator [Methylobacterium sp. ID0610]|uniref:TetR/AcrR family transcriptional regulator n=1 Tax=Methylobacterium carpenticola TaxID=3344827 RepID=UPI00369604C8